MQRLRGFKPPASAREPLHPPLRARGADAGYLVAIGLLALAIGAGALWLSERSGMGVTGATGTGMEMEADGQSDMSTMVGDESDQSGEPAEVAVAPAEVGLRVEWTSEPANPQPGQPVTLAYRVIDEQNGDVVSDLPLDHERPMHLTITSRDLTQFQHIHPELGDAGVYRVETTLPEAGTYLLYDEFVHDGQTALDRRELTVGAPSSAGAALTPDQAPQTVEGVTVALNAPEAIQAGEPAHFSFTVTRDGQPVTDLAPYLGAAAHVAIVSEDAENFAHTHGEAITMETVESVAPTDDDHAAEGDAHAIPAAFGPEVQIEHVFPNPGRYKVWAQFSQDGRVLTVPFIVEVR